MNRALAPLAILAITALSFFVFPGHTYLEQDTQIYVPILENQWSGALAGDLIVQHPHVNFTLYDELTNLIRWATRLPLQPILESEQFCFRAAGFLGIYLVALSLRLNCQAALVVTAIWALGATIKAPAVLTIEYEPTPRSFAVPLLLLAVGLALRNRYFAAALAASAGVLLHPPTMWPFFCVAAALVFIYPRKWVLLLLPVTALGLLAIIGFSGTVAEPQDFLARLPPAQEALQRIRASYGYVSTWWVEWAAQYEFFAAVALAGLWRARAAREHWILLGGLVVTGLLSVPLSWLLLEHFHLSLVPQVQPARALLFVAAIAVVASGVAGCMALEKTRKVEACAWFLFCLLVPVHATFFDWPGVKIGGVLLAALAGLVLVPARWRVASGMLLAPLLAYGAGVTLHQPIDDADLWNLARWARVEGQGVYLFPEAGRDRSPGWFRAVSLQPVYVDWKGGGQVNYLRDFSTEWSMRWQQVNARAQNPENFRALGIDYLVYAHPVATSLPLVFHDPKWWVYHLNAHGLSR